jgi:triacylglycerol esterase/lipase EstA (alpha/beta hydrolase family)
MSLRRLIVASFAALAMVQLEPAWGAEPKVRLFQENTNCPEALVPCKERRLALVFVHGLKGSKETWGQEPNYWPAMISRDVQLASYDVFRIDFDSFALADSPSISQINVEFARWADKLVDAGYQHVAFIGHSLGGLIIQRYLTQVLTGGGHAALNKFRIVFFLGTPQKGAWLADYVGFMGANPTLRILKTYEGNDFAQLLQEGMQAIVSKHDRQLCSTLRFFAAYEGKNTYGFRVVNKDSATNISHACQEFPLDHFDIAKPSGDNSPLYKGVASILHACAADHPRICPPTHSQGCLDPNQRAQITDRSQCEFGEWKNLLGASN